MSAGSIGRRSCSGFGGGASEVATGESKESKGSSAMVEQSSSTRAGEDVDGEMAEEDDTHSEG